MLDAQKPEPRTPAGAAAGELIYGLTPENRSALRLDVRFALRDAARARDLPLLGMLNQTIERNLGRVRFPSDVLDNLTREIETIRDKLPPHSPLFELLESARAHQVAAQPTGQPTPQPGTRAPASSVPLSMIEETLALKKAAASMEVTFITTIELGDSTLAGYLNYCLALGEHEKIIQTLRPRKTRFPRVWAWNLLLTALRLTDHPEFADTVAEFHTWMELHHPDTLNHDDPDDDRRLCAEKVRAIELRELAQS